MIFLAVASVICCLVGWINISSYREQIDEGYERQDEEESIADDFIDYLFEQAESFSGMTEGADKEEDEEAKITWTDDLYYNGWTPDYAKGYLAFVLEYPKIGLRRGVYCADTYAAIEEDFNMWMTVLYNPKMKLGETHLWIIGHNSLSQDLSFNRVRESEIGDIFYLYSYSGVYEYEVTDIFCEWRSAVNARYVTNMDIPDTVCYIATCGRDDIYLPDGTSTRYRDFILKGELVSHYSLTEYGELVIDEENEKREGK